MEAERVSHAVARGRVWLYLLVAAILARELDLTYVAPDLIAVREFLGG